MHAARCILCTAIVFLAGCDFSFGGPDGLKDTSNSPNCICVAKDRSDVSQCMSRQTCQTSTNGMCQGGC